MSRWRGFLRTPSWLRACIYTRTVNAWHEDPKLFSCGEVALIRKVTKTSRAESEVEMQWKHT